MVIWIIVISIVAYSLYRFFTSLNKDKEDLIDQKLHEKFEIIVDNINEAAFNGKGQVTYIDEREFNLYEENKNQIINFQYSTGHLSITWKYKYFQKEIIHKRQFDDVRNLSIFEQQNIGNGVVEEMEKIIESHKKDVLGESIDNFQPEKQKNIEVMHEISKGKKFEKDYGEIDVEKIMKNQFGNYENEFIERGGLKLMRESYAIIMNERMGEKVKYENLPPSNPLENNKIDFKNSANNNKIDFDNILEWAKYERRNANYKRAIELTNKGIDYLVFVDKSSFLEENKYNREFPYLFFSIKSKANIGLNNFKDALSNLEAAFKILRGVNPENIKLMDIFYSRIVVLKGIIDGNK